MRLPFVLLLVVSCHVASGNLWNTIIDPLKQIPKAVVDSGNAIKDKANEVGKAVVGNITTYANPRKKLR
ncbi:unnamed protein product [Bursaphelenchus xylophilus]|uniref:(pine wood nematode) hypothetical protein n=1 Tax=Bursaphelenchus xylophilus TaxID=6326 RepID=A0A1I7SP43_BURXY|nr:unnamed protein product [Bursaphelenchus xylophilus]CAG9120753.1 unnamed protein product [Bursaphelenchus xylophilus]